MRRWMRLAVYLAGMVAAGLCFAQPWAAAAQAGEPVSRAAVALWYALGAAAVFAACEGAEKLRGKG